MAMKKVKSKKRPSQPIQTTTTNFGSSTSTPQELNSFSVAAAISEASGPTQISPSRKFLSTITSPLRKSNPSQVSLATSNSFATANEHNDLLSELAKPSPTSVQTPTEISFSNNHEETMPSKKSTTSKTYPVTATAVPSATTSTNQAVTKPEPKSDEPHFDVAQNTYGCVKDIWAWGTTVPVVSNLLGITEAVAAKVTETTIHMDLPAIDQEAVVPNLKKLDDEIVTPAIWLYGMSFPPLLVRLMI